MKSYSYENKKNKNNECELKYELRICVKLFIWIQNVINIVHMKCYIEYL